ncbi:type II restriction endonuclease [Dialister sp.]|jgi:hypothetical protein|uniref:type II restriction endonuclease n=1 Tax=Dialister sp. TaxID=1955814 RepID=UPI003A5BF861
MARRKGLKQWDAITREGWLLLMGNPAVMTRLMMEIFDRLYHSVDHMDNGKNIAAALHMEYRALNSAVGWAGGKIRELVEQGRIPVYPEKPAKKRTRKKKWDAGSYETYTLDGEKVTGAALEEPETYDRAPWEYVFDGTEGEDGAYYWILKPEAASAYREIRTAKGTFSLEVRHILEEDESSAGTEGSLFAHPATVTVSRIRRELEEEESFQRKSMVEDPCCLVCGARRISLLKAFPYEEGDTRTKGPLFCPTHGALFSAHLISFTNKGELLVSPALSEKERELFHLEPGELAKAPFKHRRMAIHRKIFNQEARKLK